MYNTQYEGIIIQAVSLTVLILFSMLFAYRTKIIKPTENFKLGLFAATGGVALLYFISFIMSFFGDIFAGKSQQAAANYNAKILERNAKIDEQRAEQIMSVHNDFNLPKFDKTVQEIQGQTKVSTTLMGRPCPCWT